VSSRPDPRAEGPAPPAAPAVAPPAPAVAPPAPAVVPPRAARAAGRTRGAPVAPPAGQLAPPAPAPPGTAGPSAATAPTGSTAAAVGHLAPTPARPHGLAAVWTVLRRTVVELFNDRVTGLAAEAAFWALLSFPPLALGVLGTIGYLHGLLGAEVVADIRTTILHAAQTVLSRHVIDTVLRPVITNVLSHGRSGVVSVGFVLSLWSGSRAMNVYVDAITIAYELHGIRGIVRGRLTSLLIYIGGVVVGIVALPLIVAGPRLAATVVGGTVVAVAYWPAALLLSTAALATLYHVSVPVRTGWLRTLPGAAVALGLWVAGSVLLHLYLATQVHATSAYGQLGAVVAVLLWLYITALAVLVGAELNAEIDKIAPSAATAAARAAGRGNADIGARIPAHWRRR
jgi:membrane protein